MAEEDEIKETVPGPGDSTTESTPPPVPETHHSDTELRETVEGLSAKVDELAGTVASLIENGNDTTPVKLPWTHRRFG